MAKLSEIQQAYADPKMRKMLDLIAHTEGVKHGYNTLFGNERINNLGTHPNVRKAFKQTDGTTNYTTAAGRYQFLNGTWNGLRKQYGFRDFSPKSQDMGAIALIAQRGALKDVLSGNYQSAIQKLGPEWASLPSSTYKQNKRSWDSVNKFLGGIHSPKNIPQPNYLSDQQVAHLFPNQKKQSEPDFLSSEQVAKLFPTHQKPTTQPNYLSDDQVAQLFPRG